MFPPLLSHPQHISHSVILTPLNKTKTYRIFFLPTYNASTPPLASTVSQHKSKFCLSDCIYPTRPMDVTHPCVIQRTCRINPSWVPWPNEKPKKPDKSQRIQVFLFSPVFPPHSSTHWLSMIPFTGPINLCVGWSWNSQISLVDVITHHIISTKVLSEISVCVQVFSVLLGPQAVLVFSAHLNYIYSANKFWLAGQFIKVTVLGTEVFSTFWEYNICKCSYSIASL